MMNIGENSHNLIEAIKLGLQNDEFKMYLQFIVDNKTKNIVSAEALSRWESADGVETEPQNALVGESGCDFIQGWYYSTALPEEKAE